MTAKQVIAAYEALPAEEKREVLAEIAPTASAVLSEEQRRAKVAEAIDETFVEYDDLLRRLAQ